MAALLLAAGLVAGCGQDDRLRGVPLSAALRPAIEASRRSLRTRDGGDARVRLDLDRYRRVRAMLSSRERRAASADSLYGYWSGDLRGVLWPELAADERYRLGELDRFEALLSHQGSPDSATPLGALLRRRWFGPPPDSSTYWRVRAARAGLRPFDDVWFALRLARFERLMGRGEEAARLAQEVMPAARRLGGWSLELESWMQLAEARRSNGELDDALHAAVMAEDLARALSRQSGNVEPVLSARFLRADVLADRREVDPALDLYHATALEARAAGQFSLAANLWNRAGMLTAGVGLYEEGLAFFRQALSAAVTTGDSLNVPRHLSNIGRRHLRLGALDSCRIYLEQAERWIRAYPNPDNRRRFPLIQAEYYGQIGDFLAVDSLHALAAALTPNSSKIAELAELHLQIIEQAMERGRPALAYRSIAHLDSLRDQLHVSFADRNEAFDLDLATAEFLGRQGQFARAAAALERGDSSLSRRSDPARRWKLSEARGHLARRRDDPPSALRAYRACLDMSRGPRDQDRFASSRLLLGSLLVEQGRLDEARTLLAPGASAAFASRFRSRLTAMLLGAIVESRSGRFEVALRELDRSREFLRPSSPPDLIARIDLETGRALAGLGRRAEARRSYRRVQGRIADERHLLASDEGVFLDSDLRRELAEAMLDLAMGRTNESLRGRDAETVLRELEALLPAWHSAGAATGPIAQPQLVYFVGRDASYRWTCGGGSVQLQRLPGEAALLAAMAPVLTDLREPARRPIAAEVDALTRALGGPPPDGTGGAALTIVPDGILFSIPWPALSSGGPMGGEWIDRGPIVLAGAPAHTWTANVPPSMDGLRLLALGVDASPEAGSAGLAALRHAEREAREVCALWPPGRSSLHVGAAGRRVGTGALARFDVIHVSSHALVYAGHADQATLLLEGAAGAPVTAAEIRRLPLRAELVFLSCCEAGEGVRRGIGPAHAGLARSFLDAGARHVIASSVRVDDEAARRLAVKFYGHWLEGAALGEALRMAQLGLRDGDPRWAHPYYWAFYQAIIRYGPARSPSRRSDRPGS